LRHTKKKHQSFPKKIEIEALMQKQDVVRAILALYADRAPIHRQGIEILFDRAESRGYHIALIFEGLETCIKKNYIRDEYEPPYNDPTCEVIDERRYIEDWEFKEIFFYRGYQR